MPNPKQLLLFPLSSTCLYFTPIFPTFGRSERDCFQRLNSQLFSVLLVHPIYRYLHTYPWSLRQNVQTNQSPTSQKLSLFYLRMKILFHNMSQVLAKYRYLCEHLPKSRFTQSLLISVREKPIAVNILVVLS